MESSSIRAAFTLLGLEPTKDRAQIKSQYRSLILQNSSDRVKDPQEQERLDSLVREIKSAKALCLDFCESPKSMDDLEAEEELSRDEAKRQYMASVQLFLGRILRRRYRFWARVSLPYADSTPEFDEQIYKENLPASGKDVFAILQAESLQDDVRWVLSFQGDDPALSWVALETNEGSYRALVFFSVFPKLSHRLPAITHTTLTKESFAEILTPNGFRLLRENPTIQTWCLQGKEESDYVVRINGSSAMLFWDGWFPCSYVSSKEDLLERLPDWIQRIRQG